MCLVTPNPPVSNNTYEHANDINANDRLTPLPRIPNPISDHGLSPIPDPNFNLIAALAIYTILTLYPYPDPEPDPDPDPDPDPEPCRFVPSARAGAFKQPSNNRRQITMK